jgi:phosphoribosylanthranilate isomerase
MGEEIANKVKVKICGICEPKTLAAALDARASYIGFVFFPPSPRAVNIETASKLAKESEGRAERVGLLVNPTDVEIANIITSVPIDIIQLHGDETPERTSEVRRKFGLPVIKATAIATADDLKNSKAWSNSADMLLFDAKPPKRPNALPGGNAISFDWSLLATNRPQESWMLSGGLTPENVAEAIQLTKARAVDVSSGVETKRGIKDPGLIRAFIESVHAV